VLTLPTIVGLGLKCPYVNIHNVLAPHQAHFEYVANIEKLPVNRVVYSPRLALNSARFHNQRNAMGISIHLETVGA